jgi:S-adenosylmethionine:tRNA ribosyltransferase-isomerase
VKTSLLDYALPEQLIATHPPADRDGGRMLIVRPDGLEHARVRQFVEQLRKDDLLVLNDTKVRKARLACQRPRTAHGGGGRVELLFLHPLSENVWAALGHATRPLRPGDELCAPELQLQVVERGERGALSVRVQGDLDAALEVHGAMPIPPYLAREAEASDETRYQTVFARHLGSAAAPTAGLHITPAMLEAAQAQGVRVARVTLHVGLGTFRPVTVSDLDDHVMHSEQIEVSNEVVAAVAQTRRSGGRVVAVGTTVVRTLESAKHPTERGQVLPTKSATELLIQPGYAFSVVDALLTNFHQPKSTLLALVSAFAGYDRTVAAYRQAIQSEYRFLSYGDAMWIPQRGVHRG